MEYKTYVCRKRARFKAICGQVNIPYGTTLNGQGGFLILNDLPMCSATSQNAYDFFTQNDDGMGQESISRGKNVSLGRAAVGGLMFGGAGAVVGGFSGIKKATSQSRNIFSATVLFRVLYSNGRLIERTVKKNSREFAELMAKSR